VSVDSAGRPGNDGSSTPALSADGRFVAFSSYATNLVPGDTNGARDVFVHDRATRTTQRVSVDSVGTEGNRDSDRPLLSADGRFVAFTSYATNLVPGDTNGVQDVFVYDRQTRTTRRVSVASDGTEGNGSSYQPALSADGRFVAFYSGASNLVPGDTEGPWNHDVFVHDRQTGATERVSVNGWGYPDVDQYLSTTTSSISADGRFVAFSSRAANQVPGDTNGAGDVFVHDRQTHTTERVSVDSAGSQGNGDSFSASLSADGRFVAFLSNATNLAPGDTNNGYYDYDVFVHDRQTRTTQRVSVDSIGTPANAYSWQPALSADGRVVAFMSSATNLVERDTNAWTDVFVHDRAADAPPVRTNVQPPGMHPAGTTQVTLSLATHEGATCRYSPTPNVAYESMTAAFATTGGTQHATPVGGLRDGESYTFYIRCQDAAGNANPDDYPVALSVALPGASPGPTERVSVDSAGNEGDNSSGGSPISADGRFVAFTSNASNLVPGDTNAVSDVFVHDRQTGTTERVSVDSAGNQGDGGSSSPSISADGRFVAFTSYATNLVSGDTNGGLHVFVHDRQTGTTERVSVDSAGNEADRYSTRPALSADGRFVAFCSQASNLVPGDTNMATDVFVHDRQTGATERVSVASDGAQANYRSCESTWVGSGVSISADGRFVAFMSLASNLGPGTGVFVRDRQTGTTEVVSVASDGTQANSSYSFDPALSADGRFVAFGSWATNLVPEGRGGVLVRDRLSRTTTLVSVASDGTPGAGGSPSISADGRFVAFGSSANLAPGDNDGWPDVFVRDRLAGTTERVSVDSFANQGNNGSYYPSLSADGRFVAFSSNATNLVLGDTNGAMDVFVHDRRSPDAP
jgi:Tol biopolymer transport system component